MQTCQLILNDECDTIALAERLARHIGTGSVWLSGDLGVGKTTLTRHWLRALGVKGAIKSPTYTIVEPYVLNDRHIYHADLYRLNDPEELMLMGFFEYFDEHNALLIIEWPSRAQMLLPRPDVVIEMVRLPEDVRQVSITGVAVDGL